MIELTAEDIQVIGAALSWRLHLIECAEISHASDECREAIQILFREFVEQKRAIVLGDQQHVAIHPFADDYRCDIGQMWLPGRESRLIVDTLNMFLDWQLNSRTEVEVLTGMSLPECELVRDKLRENTSDKETL